MAEFAPSIYAVHLLGDSTFAVSDVLLRFYKISFFGVLRRSVERREAPAAAGLMIGESLIARRDPRITQGERIKTAGFGQRCEPLRQGPVTQAIIHGSGDLPGQLHGRLHLIRRSGNEITTLLGLAAGGMVRGRPRLDMGSDVGNLG